MQRQAESSAQQCGAEPDVTRRVEGAQTFTHPHRKDTIHSVLSVINRPGDILQSIGGIAKGLNLGICNLLSLFLIIWQPGMNTGHKDATREYNAGGSLGVYNCGGDSAWMWPIPPIL